MPGKSGDGKAAHPQELNLNSVVPLQYFRSVNSGLTPAEMEMAVNQALVLLDDLYAHLLLKEAMHAVDPVQALKLLLLQVRRGVTSDEKTFHQRMLDIFISLRDLHTNYLLPEPFAGSVAFLPFMVEEYFDEGGYPHYPVTRIMPAALQPPFVNGVEITHWNGMPMEEAIALNANDHAGSNAAARHLQGLLTMTSRPLVSSLPPREDWVTLTYVHSSGVNEIRFPWSVFRPQRASLAVQTDNPADPAAKAMGIDIGLAAAHRARKILFKPDAMQRESEMMHGAAAAGAQTSQPVGEDVLRNYTIFPNELEYGIRNTRSGKFGVLRIRSFNVSDHIAFAGEVARILQLLPQEGLILDVRSNPGGNILSGEHLLQLFTDRPIEPEPVCLRNTTGTLAFAKHADLKQWLPSIDLAVETGAHYSQYFPLSDPASVNSIGRRYPGKVVLLTDASCYSTTDFFAAGIQDHEIGPVIGYDQATGAGGANVWTHDLLRQFLPAGEVSSNGNGKSSPLQQLPRGMSMRISFRRSTRVGARAGLPLEDLGVQCDKLHRKTRRDVFEDGADLYESAGQGLVEMIQKG
jgi:C-terminal processing protease CtpA/Prc